MKFLPISKMEMIRRGWERPDFVLVTGDAYVDHPSFGTAIISRVLESHGYKVAILPQPSWKDTGCFKTFGKPRLGFLVNSGNVDSMVNNFSVFKNRRKVDEYAPGGQSGFRPDRAVTVYSNRIKEAYKDVPVIIGGIEASLRRFGHYDYWSDKVKRSILMDSGADLLVYGMGERAIVEIAEALDSGIDIKDVTWIKGTCYKTRELDQYGELIILPEFEKMSEPTEEGKKLYCESFKEQYRNNDYINGKGLAEPYISGVFIVQNAPQPVLEPYELDRIYELNYERAPHPSYEARGGVPAIKEVKFSLTSSRGCFGGCSFCALTYHQGRQVRGRGKDSLLKEAELLIADRDFKGYIHDVGGPTANFRGPACEKQLKHGVCKNKDCLHPKPCKEMKIDHSDYIDILKSIRGLSGVKKVFIRSGIRYDYLMADKNQEFLNELCKHHVSGTLKVAPEHTSERVLKHMRKPNKEVFLNFADKYKNINEKLQLKQYLIPYLISSHPGSTLGDAVDMALILKKMKFIPDQVQDFYPTPGTLSTCMYYTEMDPDTGDSVHVAKDIDEKKMQRALIHFNRPENRRMVEIALKEAGREEAAYELGIKAPTNFRKKQK